MRWAERLSEGDGGGLGPVLEVGLIEDIAGSPVLTERGKEQ